MARWDALSSTFGQGNPVDASSTNPIGIFIGGNPDGSKLYHLDLTSNRLFEYDLTGLYDISTMSFVTSIFIGGGSIRNIWFTADGLRMFLLSSTFISEFNLSTAWDISTAVLGSQVVIRGTGGQFAPILDTNMQDLYFRADGLQVFFVGLGTSSEGSDDRIYGQTLSIPFDITTLTAVSNNDFHVSENLPVGLFFRDNGRRMYVVGNQETTTSADSTVWQFDLGTAWNVQSVTSINRINIQANDNAPTSLYFLNTPSPNAGARFWVMGKSNKAVQEYTMTQIELEHEFKVGALLTREFIEFTTNARLVKVQKEEFFIGARLVLFCDTINDSTGWITTNGGTELLVDNVSFPNVIHFESLAGGGGVTERWTRKDIGVNVSGDIKLEFKFDFQSMKPTGTSDSAEFRIFLQEQNIHPDNSTGSRIGCILDPTRDDSHNLYGQVDDGISTVTSIQGGNFNQRTTHVYPDIGVAGGVDPELLGPYFITVELKDNKFRMSLFLDENRTIHARGSPREVDATGINPTNLRHLIISNSKGASSSFSLLTGDIDDIYITQNEPLPPLAVNTQTATLVEDWESYAEFTQNPDGWFGETDLAIRPNNEFNVSSAIFNQSVSLPTISNTGGLYIKKDTGDKMWIINSSAKTIALFNLPTPFSLTGAVFADLASIEAGTGGSETPVGFDWKDNGFRIYTIDSVLSQSGINNNLKEWSTSTGAFDIFGALIFVKEENTRDELNEGKTVGVNINPLGTRLYIVSQATTASDITNGWTNGIHQYNMDIQPFNIANRGLIVGSLAIGDGLTDPREMWMSDDGLKLIVIGNNQINEYDLGTAFEINTSVFASSRNILPAIAGRAVVMRPDGLKMFITDQSGITPDNVFEFDIPTTFIPSIDIKQVSTDFPNGGIKSYKLHTKYSGDGINNPVMSSSVLGKRIVTLPNPNGGELLIPYRFTAETRSQLMKIGAGAPVDDRARGGVYIRYELVQGAPFDTQSPNDGLAIVVHRNTNAPTGEPVNTFNDLESNFSLINTNTGLPIEVDQPDGIYHRTIANLRDIFHADAVFNNRGWDFESHVKSISIGYWVDSTNTTTGNVEALMYGDEINLLPDLFKEHEFKTNVILKKTDKVEFRIRALLVVKKEFEFKINARVGDSFKEHEFKIGVKIVNRHAQNGTQVFATLKALGQEKEFRVGKLIQKTDKVEPRINALLGNIGQVKPSIGKLLKAFDQEHDFFVSAFIGEINKEEFRVNSLLKAFGQEEEFIVNALLEITKEFEFRVNAQLVVIPNKEDFQINAIIGFSEPQSILDVESVIGHKTGLQS